MDEPSQPLPDFFISRAGAHPADVAMAAKVGSIIEAEGHRVVLQQWDFKNRNFMERMDAALGSGARVIAIMSPEYLATDYCAAEWMHALDGDPLNRKARLIVLRATECEPRGLLRTIAYWDLVPVRERDDLLAAIVKDAIRPDAERRHDGPLGAHWRSPRALLHDAIKPTASFTGRDEQLKTIHDALWSGKDAAIAITQPAAVTGLGGIGKSTLAREYAWRHQDDYAGIWWLNAASDANAKSWGEVEQGLVDLGDHFLRGLARAKDRAEAARYALKFLADGGFAKPWLLIFDNVDNGRVLEDWRPQGNAHVLVTSRIGNWSSAVKPIEVDAWEPGEAIDYLGKETGRADLSEADFSALADNLGCLPLALAHAAAYLRHRKAVTVTDYLDDLDRHMDERPKDAEYPSPVYATFRAALLQAEAEAPGALALVSIAAFFAPDDIPEELFQQDASRYPQELRPAVAKRAHLGEILGVLDDLSLIDFEPETRTFSIHRIVQAAARDRLDDRRDNWAQGAVGIMHSAFPVPSQETWPRCARLVAHVRALNAHVPSEASVPNLGLILGAAGDYSRGRTALADVRWFFESALKIFERLAKAHPKNVEWQRNLAVSQERVGDVRVDQGNLADALAAYHASREIHKRLAKADPGNDGLLLDLYASHDKIGNVLQAQGNLPEALAAFEASLAIRERLAKIDPENAGCQRNLFVSHIKIGNILLQQRNLPAALAAFNVSFTIAERLAKAQPGNAEWQRDLSIAHNYVGDVLVQQGSLPHALVTYKASLAIRELLAKADPGNAERQRDLSVSQQMMGDVLARQGSYPDALAIFYASLAIAERLAKADPENAVRQRDLSVSHHYIGDLFRAQENLSGALAAFTASHDILERLAKADPANAEWQRDLAASHERLGDIHSRQEKIEEARQAFERALAVYEALIARYPDDVHSRVNSVVPRRRLSRLDQKNARRHLEAALAILKPLAAENRLDARRLAWIGEMEKELRAL